MTAWPYRRRVIGYPEEIPVPQMRVGGNLPGIVHCATGHSGGLKLAHHLVLVPGGGPLSDIFVELFAVVQAAFSSLQVHTVSPFLPKRPAEIHPFGVGRYGDGDPGIVARARVETVGGEVGVAVAPAGRYSFVHRVVHERLAQLHHARLVLGKVDPLTLAGALTVGDGQQDGVGRRQRAEYIVVKDAPLHRFSALVTSEVGQAGYCLDAGAVADVILPGTGAAICGGVQHDDVFLDFLQLRVVQAEVAHHPGREVLGYDVADTDQLLEQVLAPLGVQVKAETQLVAVNFVIGPTVIPCIPLYLAVRLGTAAGRVGSYCGLNLDDLGSVRRQGVDGVRQRPDLAWLDDADAA